MPDIHSGYGFAIGNVAAFDMDADGVVSPGGVGFDINCERAGLQGRWCAWPMHGAPAAATDLGAMCFKVAAVCSWGSVLNAVFRCRPSLARHGMSHVHAMQAV